MIRTVLDLGVKYNKLTVFGSNKRDDPLSTVLDLGVKYNKLTVFGSNKRDDPLTLI